MNKEQVVQFIKTHYSKDGDEWGNESLYNAWTLGCEIQREFELFEEFPDLFSKKCSSMSLPPLRQDEYIFEKIMDIFNEFEEES